jgi:hypothetical protein
MSALDPPVSPPILAQDASPPGHPRSWIVDEFRSVLHGYLVPKLTA